ncbi:hypothetical protein EBZ39_05655 [bacterium]|nr:hypothetical protein [bacterium]
MGQATFSNNTTFKISGGAQGTTLNGSSGSVTTAANEYIILSLASNNTNNNINGITGMASGNYVFHIGQSSTFTWTAAVSPSFGFSYSYVKFINTP